MIAETFRRLPEGKHMSPPTSFKTLASLQDPRLRRPIAIKCASEEWKRNPDKTALNRLLILPIRP